MENADESPADRLEQALRDLEKRKNSAAELAVKMAPELERLAELHAKLEALPQKERREVLDAMGLKHVSAAPTPITPITPRVRPPEPETRVRGSSSGLAGMIKASRPIEIDWPFWKNMRTVKLWQACALITSLDPDSLKQSPQAWMAGPGAGPVFDERCFPNPNSRDRFSKALRLAANAVSYMDGPIFPKGTPRPGNNQDKDVSLNEVAAFFRSCEWPDIPEPIQSLVVPVQTPAPESYTAIKKEGYVLKKAALINKYSDEWRSIDADFNHASENGLSAAAKATGHGDWYESAVLEWADQRGKRTATEAKRAPNSVFDLSGTRHTPNG